MEIEDLLAALEEIEPDAFAEALQEQGGAHFKAIRNPAYKEGRAEGQQEAEKARAKIASLKKEKQDLEACIDELAEEQPEVAELRGKYDAKIAELKEQLDAKDEEIASVRKESKATLLEKEQQFFQQQAKSWLMTEGRVNDPDVAEIKIQKAMQDGRVKFDDDLQPVVYESDGDVPSPVTGGKKPHEVFGENLLQSIDDKFIDDPRPGSTGLGNTNGRATGRRLSRQQFEKLGPGEQKDFVMDGGVVVS